METNGDSRGKRKHPRSPATDRPTKHFREDSMDIDDQILPDGSDGFQELETRLLPATTATHDSAEWQRTIEAVVRNVVSIRFCQTCSFDTDSAITSEATGFVVDAEKGYILTNRHVVCAGPFWGYCVFDNHEEVRSRRRLRGYLLILVCSVRCLSCVPRPYSRLRYSTV